MMGASNFHITSIKEAYSIHLASAGYTAVAVIENMFQPLRVLFILVQIGKLRFNLALDFAFAEILR